MIIWVTEGNTALDVSDASFCTFVPERIPSWILQPNEESACANKVSATKHATNQANLIASSENPDFFYRSSVSIFFKRREIQHGIVAAFLFLSLTGQLPC